MTVILVIVINYLELVQRKHGWSNSVFSVFLCCKIYYSNGMNFIIDI